MKKLVILLAALALAAPLRAADVTITCTAETDDSTGKWVRVDFSNPSGPAVHMAGLGMNLQVNNACVIDQIKDFPAQGATVPTSTVPTGYAVYMGNIKFSGDGSQVTAFGNPVAPAIAPGALGGLNTAGITVEMGALYKHVGGTPPPDSGTLFRIHVKPPFPAPLSANVSIAAENTRGGIILEGTPPVQANLVSVGCTINFECYVGAADYTAQWVVVGKPDCWCFKRQCHGDQDNLQYGKSKVWVGAPELTVLTAAWQKTAAQIIGQSTDPDGGGPLGPVLWACADFDHLPYGKTNARVAAPDLTILTTYWNKLPGGPGDPPADCLPGNRP